MRATKSTLGPLAIAAIAVSAPTSAGAEPTNDGYCEFVENVAAAESAVLMGPIVFSEIGRIEQSSQAVLPGDQPGTVRFIGGVRVRLSGIYEGIATKRRAKAECKRHSALEQIRGETLYRALEARADVLDGAMSKADSIMSAVAADLGARRTTAQEATATRLRVEELRRLSSETHQAMSILPRPTGGNLTLATFQQADDEVERNNAKLRRAKAFDVSVRVGVDGFLDGSVNADTSSPYFAVLSVGINLGTLFQGGANDRAAEGRRRYVRSGRDPLSVDATADRLRAQIETAERREKETAALESDLQHQVKMLDRIGSEESRRYKQVVWFELIKVRAEHAYHEAHARALREVVGTAGGNR